jgi:hypothetical protein
MTASVVCCLKKNQRVELQPVGENVRNSKFKILGFVVRVFNGHSFPGSKEADGVKITIHPCTRVNVWNYTSISPYFFTAWCLIKHVHFT